MNRPFYCFLLSFIVKYVAPEKLKNKISGATIESCLGRQQNVAVAGQHGRIGTSCPGVQLKLPKMLPSAIKYYKY